MTAVLRGTFLSTGDAELISTETNGAHHNTSSACNVDAMAGSEAGKQQEDRERDRDLFPQEEELTTINYRLARVADLLDNSEVPVDRKTSTCFEKNAYLAVVTDDDEEEEEDLKQENGAWDGDDEESDSDENVNLQQEAEDDLDGFGEFAQAPKQEESDEDGDEMMSLITLPRKNQNLSFSLPASFTKFLGFGPKEEEKEKEKRSLLNGNNETDEDDDDSNDEKLSNDTSRLLRSSSGDCYHAVHHSDEDDLLSEPGEYRLEAFYPSDDDSHGSRDEPSHAHLPDLCRRIHGVGSQSALGYNHNSSRVFAETMSDEYMAAMDIETSTERRGLLDEVGKAMSSITTIIMQKRAEFQAAGEDQDRKRMLVYISELEHKLDQTETELLSWRERAEQLQLEVNRLKKEKGGGEESEEPPENDGKDHSLIFFEDNLADNTVNDSYREGILINTAPERVFDPLEVTREVVVEKDDLMDPAHYKQIALSPTPAPQATEKRRSSSPSEEILHLGSAAEQGSRLKALGWQTRDPFA